MHFFKQNHGLAVLAQCVNVSGDKVSHNEIRQSDLLDMLRATECLSADGLGLRPTAARALSKFSGVRTVLTLPSSFLFAAEAVVRNFYAFLDSVVIRNRSMSPSVKMSSEYLLRWHHIR
jgi:hypothetical protein